MKKRVLVVEDDVLSRQVISAYLESMDFQVFSAESGRHALAMIKEEPVDLLLTDFAMAGMDGSALTRKVKKLFPVPIVIGMSSGDAEEQFLEAGADEFLKKPFGIRELEDMLRDIFSIPG